MYVWYVWYACVHTYRVRVGEDQGRGVDHPRVRQRALCVYVCIFVCQYASTCIYAQVCVLPPNSMQNMETGLVSLTCKYVRMCVHGREYVCAYSIHGEDD